MRLKSIGCGGRSGGLGFRCIVGRGARAGGKHKIGRCRDPKEGAWKMPTLTVQINEHAAKGLDSLGDSLEADWVVVEALLRDGVWRVGQQLVDIAEGGSDLKGGELAQLAERLATLVAAITHSETS